MLLYFCNSARKYISSLGGKIQIYKAVFKHHKHKRELCFNQCITLKNEAKKGKIEGANTLFNSGIEALRTSIGRLDFWLHLRPDFTFHIWWSPHCWWNPSLLILFSCHRAALWHRTAESTTPTCAVATLAWQLTFPCRASLLLILLDH